MTINDLTTIEIRLLALCLFFRGSSSALVRILGLRTAAIQRNHPICAGSTDTGELVRQMRLIGRDGGEAR